MEPGVRCERPAGVVRVWSLGEGNYRAFAHQGRTATSTDSGLTFVDDCAPIGISALNQSPLALVVGGWRLYYGVFGDRYPTEPNRIGGKGATAISDDGRTWQPEPGYRFTAAFQPAALDLGHGSLALYYVGID